MTFKSLLMAVQPTPICEQALPHVVEFAADLGADLTGVSARAPFFFSDPWIVGGDIIQQLAEDDAAQLKEAHERFQTASQRLNGHAHWLTGRDFPNRVINDAAAGADLIVATMETGPEASTVDLSSLVLETGVPILAVPNPVSRISTQTILIAWRNTADARRAVTAALPLLEKAETVFIVQVARENEANEAWVGLRAIRDRLKLHGITAETDLVFKGGQGDAAALLNAAEERDVDLIVLGGYGHMRAREWVLGGMTADLLANTTIPLFLVH
jgi:nucleotide-binding universal stress UspA family protein